MTEKEFLSKRHMAYDNFQLPNCDEKHKRAVERFHRACKDAMIEAKVDRAVELMERIAARRNAPIPDAENAGPSAWELMTQHQPSADDMAAQFQPSADEQARICAEAEAAYAARNPHKKKAGLCENEDKAENDEGGLYKNEKKVTVPANRFADAAPAVSFKSRCQQSEAAYAARNPHKREAAR